MTAMEVTVANEIPAIIAAEVNVKVTDIYNSP
mgnify:CR=1 FL=1